MVRFLTSIAHYITVSIILISLAFSPLVYTQTAHGEARKGNIERQALTKHTLTGIYYIDIPINFSSAQAKSYELYTALANYLVANDLAYILEVQDQGVRVGSPKLSSAQEFRDLFKAYENSIPSNYSHPDYSPFYTLPDVTPAAANLESIADEYVNANIENTRQGIIGAGGIDNYIQSLFSGLGPWSDNPAVKPIIEAKLREKFGTVSEKSAPIISDTKPQDIPTIKPAPESARLFSPEERAVEQERIRRIEDDRQQQEDQRKIDEQTRAEETAKEALKRAKTDEEQRIAEEARRKAEQARIAAEQEAQKHQQEKALRKAQEEQKQTEEQRKVQTAAEEAKRIAPPQDTSNVNKPISQQSTTKVSVSISASEPATSPSSPVTITWSSTNAISCTINGDSRPLSGFLTETLKASKQYALSCAGNNETATDEVSVEVDLPLNEITTWETTRDVVIPYILPFERIVAPIIKPVASTVWKVAGGAITKIGTEAVATKGVIRELTAGLQKFFGGIGEKIGKIFFKNTDEAATAIVSVSQVTSKIPAQYDEVAKFIKLEAELASQNPKMLEALNDFASNVAEGGIKTGKGFSSADALKKYFGLEKMRQNMELQHVVEQRLAGKPFDPTLIHNSANALVVPKWVNQGLNWYYSSKVKLTSGDQTIRKWLESQTFAEQFRFGVESLEQCFKKELEGCINAFNKYR